MDDDQQITAPVNDKLNNVSNVGIAIVITVFIGIILYFLYSDKMGVKKITNWVRRIMEKQKNNLGLDNIREPN